MSNSRPALITDIVLLAGLFAFAHQLDRSDRGRAGRAAQSVSADNGLRPSQEPPGVQKGRINQPGRGRSASSPTGIPGKGWMDVFWRIYNQLQNDRLLAVAAGVVFYMLLALFPALTALVSLYGLVSDPAEINAQLALLAGVVPSDVVAIIRDQVTRVSEARSGSLGLGFLIGIAFALWSTNGGMKAIIDSLNVVYDEREERSFIVLTLVSFAFTIGSLVFVVLAMSAVVITPLVLPWLGMESLSERIISLLRWPALLIIVLLWLSLLYRYGPCRTAAQWRWLSVGSLFAALCWLAASSLFSWYLSNFANYNVTYGSLGAVIGLMMWLWVSVIVILFGAELNAELEHQTAEDTTVRPEQPLGERGAVMADTVGKAWR
jgi:membrane protein